MKSLTNKVALVTGAGSPRGMGRAIVEALAAQGANMIVSDIAQGDPDPLMEMLGYRYGAGQGLDEAVAAAEAVGAHAAACTADVTQAEQVEALVAFAMQSMGRIDILVNVAGGSWGTNRVADYDPDQWLKTVRVNLFGPFLTTKYCLPHMEAQGGGSIVNIASIAAVRSHEMLSAYGAAKAGVVQFTRDVATEYGPAGIRANAILPGDIRTDMLEMEFRGMSAMLGMSESDIAQMAAESAPLKRLGEVQDIAALTAFLCSDAASFLTGLAIPATGGKDLPFRSH